MKEYPQERQGATEMTFCLIRFELSQFMRRCNFAGPGDNSRAADMTLEEKEKLIDEWHRKLEDKYLKHCDMAAPIYWVAATVARLILAKMWLMVHHPRSFSHHGQAGSTLSPETRDRVFITSVEVIEFSHLLEKHENTAKWGWLFRTYMQWQSVAFALSEICQRPPGPDVDRAWRAIELVCDEKMMDSHKFRRGMLWKPLRHLLARARARRAAQEAQAAAAAAATTQATPVGRKGDVLFPDISSSTPMERFMHDYPNNAVTAAMETFGMADVDGPPYASGASMPVQAGGDGGAVQVHVQNLERNMSQDRSSGTHWTPDGAVPMGGGNENLLDFGWSPTLGDFNVGPEPFGRYLMKIQEEWF